MPWGRMVIRQATRGMKGGREEVPCSEGQDWGEDRKMRKEQARKQVLRSPLFPLSFLPGCSGLHSP